MNCSFLTGKYMFSRTENKGVYVPSRFELEEYCKSIRYKMCPFVFPRNFQAKSKERADRKVTFY